MSTEESWFALILWFKLLLNLLFWSYSNKKSSFSFKLCDFSVLICWLYRLVFNFGYLLSDYK